MSDEEAPQPKASFFTNLKAKLRPAREARPLVLNPAEKLFRKILWITVTFCLLGIVLSSLWMARTWRKEHAPTPAAAEVAKVEPESDDEDDEPDEGEKEVHLGTSPIPPEVLERQTGQLMPGHDLTDPEIESSRNIASLLKDDLHVEQLYRFAEIPDLDAGSSGREGITILSASVVLEVTTLEAQKEVESRKTELKSMIASLVADRNGASLRTFAGMAKLKEDIQREMNHTLQNGQVTDVLFSKYQVQ